MSSRWEADTSDQPPFIHRQIVEVPPLLLLVLNKILLTLVATQANSHTTVIPFSFKSNSTLIGPQKYIASCSSQWALHLKSASKERPQRQTLKSLMYKNQNFFNFSKKFCIHVAHNQKLIGSHVVLFTIVILKSSSPERPGFILMRTAHKYI